MTFSRVIDLSGQRFGKLLVIRKDISKPTGDGIPASWICDCDCGIQKSIKSKLLRNGDAKSCGCMQRIHQPGSKPRGQRLMDMAGERFGDCVVIRFVERRKNRTIWECLCDCGNIFTTGAQDLRGNQCFSCGCTQYQRASITRQLKPGRRRTSKFDLTNNRFGKLIVIGRSSPKGEFWDVKCDCGTVKAVQSNALRTGKTRSCGCARYDKTVNHDRAAEKTEAEHEIDRNYGINL